MSDDHLRDKIVQYFIVGLLAAVVIFLIFGLARGDGDDDTAVPEVSVNTRPQVPKRVSLDPQVGCQQLDIPKGLGKTEKTFPPNPGVSARASGARKATISVTIPTSTQECRVSEIRVQLDSTADQMPAKGRRISVLTGPPVRKITITLDKGSGAPEIATAYALTSNQRTSNGAAVRVR